MKKICLQLLCVVLLLVLSTQAVRADIPSPGSIDSLGGFALVVLIVLGALVVVIGVVAWLVIRGIRKKRAREDLG